MAARGIGWGSVIARALAATAGAYALCYAWIAASALLLPHITTLDTVDATIIATCTAFVVFTVLILRAFSIRSPMRLWIEIAAGTAVPLLLLGLFS